MNSYEVNKHLTRNSEEAYLSRKVVFPKNGNKIIRSFNPNHIRKSTKLCMLSVTEAAGVTGSVVETVWYTFDGSVPRPNNGHKMTSRSILKLPPEAVKVARFSNQPGKQSSIFYLRMEQLS